MLEGVRDDHGLHREYWETNATQRRDALVSQTPIYIFELALSSEVENLMRLMLFLQILTNVADKILY